MLLPLVFRTITRKEFNEATVWYEERRVGLGAEFVAEVETPRDIQSRPKM